MNIFKKDPSFVILSAYQADKSAIQNTVNTAILDRTLAASGVECGKCIGRYNGRHEKAFIVLTYSGRRDRAYRLCLEEAARYNQESILFVDERLRATLDYIAPAEGSPARKTLGTWREATIPEIQSDADITVGPDRRTWIAAP